MEVMLNRLKTRLAYVKLFTRLASRIHREVSSISTRSSAEILLVALSWTKLAAKRTSAELRVGIEKSFAVKRMLKFANSLPQLWPAQAGGRIAAFQVGKGCRYVVTASKVCSVHRVNYWKC